MPYKRKYIKRAFGGRKRYKRATRRTRKLYRIYRRKRAIRRTIRRGGPIHHVKKLYYDTYTIPLSPATVAATTWNFKLSEVAAQLAPEIAMYQFYKISKVVVSFMPRFNSIQENAACLDGYNFGFFGSGMDYSGQLGNFTGIQDVFDDCTGKITRGWRTHTRVIKPKVAEMLYAGVATTQYQNKRSGWIDTNDEDVFHYGLRTIWEGSIPTKVPAGTGRDVDFTYDVFIKYYIAFKQPNK